MNPTLIRTGMENVKKVGTHPIHVLSRMVILDKGHILLCKTLGLNLNFYFLPGGHIEPGESAKMAVCRELFEESGAVCQIKRFLGCLEYRFKADNERICHTHEYNLVFEGESESLKFSSTLPQLEAQIKLKWINLTKINDFDLRPSSLKTLIPNWLASSSNQAFQSETTL